MTETGLSRERWSVRRLHAARVGMAYRAVAVLVCGVGFASTTASAQARGPQAPDSRAVRQAKEQPVRFEENRGQADARVRYISRARDYTVALTDDEALLLVRRPASSAGKPRLEASDLALVRMRLAGASPTPRITAGDRLPGKVYFAGTDAPASLTPIDTFARVEYSGVYPGIDLVYYGDDHHLEFDFVVAPFADPNRIALSLDGADGLTLTDAGDLSMRVGGAEVRLEKPLVYQERGGRRVEIAGAYVLPADDTHTVRLRLGSYDRSLPLVIDPAWMTVFGSTNEDRLSGFAVDSAGQPRVLGDTFDPATFPFTQHESGVLPSPNCFFTKLNGTTGLTTYTILFENTQRCGTLALAPNDVAYFTGFVYPNGFHNNQGTTVTAVDDSSGAPVISRFGVSNYDSSAPGEGVAALAVNGLGHVFLLGPCRIVESGDPPLQLSGYNETPDPARPFIAAGCASPKPGTSEKYQPVLTVVDGSGTFLYGSFLWSGEEVTRYGLAADAADRAYIVGGQVEPFTVLSTADAYRADCPTGGSVSEICAYLMVLDTTTVGKDSLVYASYLWNTQNVETVAVRLGPAGAVYVATDGRVFDDFPSNRPTDPSSWPFSLYPALRDGVQLARFNPDANGVPSQFHFSTVFDPSRGVVALNGYTARDALADLRLFPSGAPAVASVAYTSSLAPMGIVTTFTPDGDRLGEVWTQNLGTRTPIGFGVGTGSGGSLFLAGQIEQVGAQDSEVFVERIDAVDPGANRPPTVRIFEALTSVYADSPTAGALLQINALAADPEGDPLTYSWTGPFTDNPVTTNNYLIARVPLGMQQTVTVTVDDGHGNVVSASRTFDVVGTPFVGTTATPVDSDINGLVYNYAPITITAAGIGAGGGNAYLHTRLDQNPPIPAHLQAGSPPIYFDLSTDAALIAPIALCVDTRGMSFANPANIRLYQYQQSGPLASWVDITSAGYPQGNQLCGQSNTLGTFAIFYPQVPATAVQTIAGNGVLKGSNDGIGGSPIDDFQDGPATATALPYLFGGAYDRANNYLFVSSGDDILRLNLNNNTIARVAGNGVGVPGSIDGPGGDPRDDLVEGGDAFNTYVGGPAELVVSPTGEVVFFDRNTCRIRRLDAQGRLWAVAGNGTCGFSGDGFSAGLASLSYGQMAFDAAGNLFLADYTNARVRRIDALTNVIDTVVGDGTFAIPVNGASARSAIGLPAGIAFDSQGHLVVAGGMHLLRISPGADALVDGDADEVISVLGGCNTNCMLPFNGDGVAVSHPQVYLPGLGHVTVAQDGAVIFSDSFRIRRIAPGADGIVTGAADDTISTIAGYYDWATLSQIPNFNGDTFSTQSRFSHFLSAVEDAQGRIIVVDGNNFRVRRFGLAPPPLDPDSADLAIAATDAVDPVNTGGSLRYDITVTNNGPGAATGVAMAYVIPAGALFESAASTNAIACSTPAVGSPGTVTCDFGTLASGASRAVEITITPQTVGALSSTFAITAAESDPIGGNNSTTVTTTVTLSPAIISVSEVIAVSDTVGLLPSAMIGVTEQITVTDLPGVLPSAMIGIAEQIVVTDTTGLLPSAMIGVSEQITVTDSPTTSVDSVPPVLSLPGPIVTEAQTPAGAVVTFSASATDDKPGPVQVSCSPASASVFPFNGSSPTTTTVTCTATDAGGNVTTGSFSVTVQDTTAPQVLTAQLTIAATEATGARGNVPQAPHTPLLQQLPLLAGAIDAGDANPARLPVQWVACGNHAQVLGPVADSTLYPIGPNCFYYVFRDGSGNVGTGIGTIEVSAPIGGHINVPNVPVTATDLSNVPLPVTATFLGLDQPGLLTAVPPQFIPPPPAGMIFAGPPFDLHSTALAQAPVVVCMRPTFGDVAERLLALEFFQWVDRTETTNSTGEICSRPDQLGTFALVRRDLSDLTLTLTPPSATVNLSASNRHNVVAWVADTSDPSARVILSGNFPVSIEYRNPGVPNSPLSLAIQNDPAGRPSLLTVWLGTGSGGELRSTALQVAEVINNGVAPFNESGNFDFVGANIWPTSFGDGIVAPKPPMRLVRLLISTQPFIIDPWCYVSTPGICSTYVTNQDDGPHTTSLTAILDLNDNRRVDVPELSALAEVTWADVTRPTLFLPSDITVPASGPSGAEVSFTVGASDDFDDFPVKSCSPASGSTFPIGTTTVTCTATDASGNVATGSFTVRVVGATGVSLLSPIGGDKVFVNVPVTIRWNATGAPASFDVLLSRSATAPFDSVCANVPGTAKSCTWVPAGGATSQARIRVVASDSAGTATDTSGTFTIATSLPAITLTSPVWPTTWAVGTTQTIGWQHNLGLAASFRLEASRDWGFSWAMVADAVPSTTATTGSFSWTVTGPATPYVLIRATWTGGPVDDADIVAIEDPRITVTDSNGGDTWTIGQTRTVRWSHNLGADQSVSIELSRDGGATWSPLAASTQNTSATGGQLAWTVAGPATSRARIRVRWLANASAQDVSDQDFTIASRIQISRVQNYAASSASVVISRVKTTVQWTHNYPTGQSFDFEVSTDGGATWTFLRSAVPGASAFPSVEVRLPDPPTPSATALVRVSPSGVPGDGALSPPFTLDKPVVTVTMPTAATQWAIGTTQNVQYTRNFSGGAGGGWMALTAVSRDGGVTWLPAGTAQWKVTGPAGPVRMRLTIYDPSVGVIAEDESEDFLITSGIQITRVQNYGAVSSGVISRVKTTVQWTHPYPAGQSFDFEVSTDGGATWTFLRSAVPGASALPSVEVRLPDPPTPSATGLVRVSPSGVPGDGALSPPFTLAKPVVTVTTPTAATQWAIGTTQTIQYMRNFTGGAGSGWLALTSVSRDGGVTWLPAGTTQWKVTGPAGPARMRLTIYDPSVGVIVEDDSEDFVIVPGVRVTSPNSAVSWVAGSTHTINWTHNYGAAKTFDIDFSADGGVTWSSFATGVAAATATTGSYTAPMPSVVTSQGRFRVSPAGLPGDGDVSDVPFTLRPLIIGP